jgi:YqxM protein
MTEEKNALMQFTVLILENPKNGAVVSTGTVSPLNTVAKQTIFDNTQKSGNYIFKVYQRTGHPGKGSFWFAEINLKCKH